MNGEKQEESSASHEKQFSCEADKLKIWQYIGKQIKQWLFLILIKKDSEEFLCPNHRMLRKYRNVFIYKKLFDTHYVPLYPRDIFNLKISTFKCFYGIFPILCVHIYL